MERGGGRSTTNVSPIDLTFAIISSSNPGLFNHTERTGLLSLTWCSVQPRIVVIGSVSIYNTRKRNGEVCSLPNFSLYASSHPTLRMFKGAWLSDEECRLIQTIEELTRAGKSDMSAAGFWVFVSKEMGATRTPKQCQSKWCVFFSLICILSGLCILQV